MEAVVDAPRGAAGRGAGDHVVQFYRDGHDGAEGAGDYLAAAARNGEAAIAIGTPQRLLAFEKRMAGAGIDVPGAVARGDYRTVDAAGTLREIVAGRRPDPAGFEQVIGGLIKEAAGTGRPVRVFGELVGLMWDAGWIAGAVELEELWIGLGRRYPFGLWCGYPAEPMGDPGVADAVTDVCRLHAVVVGDVPDGYAPPGDAGERTVRRRYSASLDEPGRARRFATAALETWGLGDLADDAALTVAELTANAVIHARSGFTITLTADPGTVLISVRDDAPLPVDGDGRALPAAAPHGLGAVAALASRWGVDPAEPAESGKIVWAEFRR